PASGQCEAFHRTSGWGRVGLPLGVRTDAGGRPCMSVSWCARLGSPNKETSFMAESNVTTGSLQAFLDAFNAHDVDEVMSFFTEDCVLDMPRGPAPGGLRLVAKEQVRQGIQSRF